MSGIVYGSVALLPCVVVLALWRPLPSLAVRSGKITEPDAKGTALSVGTVLGLLVGVGIANYSTMAIADFPLLVAVVTLLLVLMIGLMGKYYLSLSPLTTSALVLFAGLFPAAVNLGKYPTGPATVLAGTMILVPVGISAAAYLVNQLEGYGDIGMAAMAIAALSGIAFLEGETEALLMLLAGFGAMVPLLAHVARRQASALIGDVGTSALGALIAMAAISGGFELPAVIVFIPYFLNLGLKASGRSLAQGLMKVSGDRRCSALLLMGIEAIFGVLAIALYGGW